MSHPDELHAEEVLAFLASRDVPPAETQPERAQAYREAAAVLVAVEDPERLRPLGGTPTAGAAAELLGDELVPATGHKFAGRVMLTPGVRAETIRELVSTGRLEEALAANPDQQNSSLQAHFECYLRREAPPLDQQSLEELEATRQISLWLGGVVEGVPAAAEVDGLIAYRKLLELFETLAGDAVFRGRESELDQLRNYIGLPTETLRGRVRGAFKWAEPERQPAVSVSGVGGAGKSSLVARFMLEHARLPEDRRVPFGYLDFARASLDVGDQLGLCLELLRQLDLQFPGDAGFADIRDRAAQLPEATAASTPQTRPGEVTEIRVAGVSGSPPAAILGEQAVPRQVSGDAIAGFYRPPDDGAGDRNRDARPASDRRVEVYSWGGTTSRSKVRVLWLALLPFLLGNLAGWMCSASTRSSRWRFRLHRLAFGLGALALTVNAALIAVLISADVLAYQATRAGITLHKWWLAPLGWRFVARHPARPVTLGILAVLLVTLAVFWLASRAWRYEAVRPPFSVTSARLGRPRLAAAAALPDGLADDEFWDGGSSVRLATSVHLAVVLGFLAIVLGVTTQALAGSPRAAALGWAALALGAAAVALGVCYVGLDALTTPPADPPDDARAPDDGARALGDVYRGWMAYLPALAAAALTAAGVFAWLQPAAAPGRAADLPGTAAVTGWTALAMAVVLVIALISALAGLRGRRGTLTGGSWVTLMLAFSLLNTVMLGLGTWLAHVAGPVTSDAAVAAAEPFDRGGQLYLPSLITSGVPLLAWVAVLAAVAFGEIEAVRWIRARRLPGPITRRYQEEAAAFRNQLSASRKNWYWSGLPPFAPPGNPSEGDDPSRGWEQRVARAQFAGRASHDAAWLLWATVLGQLVAAACVWRLHVQPPVAIRDLGIGIAILTLPALMALLHLTWNDRARLHIVKACWDMGTFWPRSYHPLAPPCYTERAVPDLQRRMRWRHDDGGHVMLVAHGHGAVLATVALIQPGCRPEDDRPALITAGSPVGKIYGWAFPAYFGQGLLAPLEPGGSARLHEWRNFYYPTDLIGGAVARGFRATPSAPVDTTLLDPAECYYVYGEQPAVPRGHAGYWTDPRIWASVNTVSWPEEQTDNQPELLPGDQLARARDLLGEALDRMRRLLGPRPYVVVLDTFEEVQYRGEQRAQPLWEMLSELQDRAPFLRVVVAGRAPVESLRLAGRPPRSIALGGLDHEAAMAFLGAQGIIDRTLQGKLVQTAGRLPLSLKLVSMAAQQTPGGAAALLDPANGGLSVLAASDGVIQGQLYGRILDHIADEGVRRLAHPGLVLRRINAELIFKVLNEPCGLGIRTVPEAQELFDELRRESSLVAVDSSDGDLVNRRELRQVMLKMLLAGAPAQVKQIRRGAVGWYAGQAGRRARAEELYHRLHLGEQVGQGELSDPEVRSSIQAVIEEFPPGIQLDLAALGLKVSPEIIEAAGREQRHAVIAAQIEELLPYGPGSAGQAQEIFASVQSDLGGASLRFGAGARGEASPLFRSGARIATQGGDERQALDLIERGLESAAREGAAALTLELLQERAWLYRIRDRAEQAEGLTRLGERARRHQDRPALLQYLAQSIDPGDPAAPGHLPALGDLLSHADPVDAWGLVPALRPAVELAAGVQEEALLVPLRSLVLAQGGPFQLSVFPDRVSQSALGVLQSADPGAFARAFLRLCEIWPYRILFVAAPYGRGGEQLTEE